MRLHQLARRLPDEVWAAFEPVLPPVVWCGEGRPPASNHACLHGLIYVPITGIGWEYVPPCFPSGKTIQRRLAVWLLLRMPAGLDLDVAESPTRADALAARDTLFDVVHDFPFQRAEHKGAWLASLLTPAAWFAFDGPSPFFLIDGNCRGAGKGLLADTCGITLTGRRFAVMSYDHDPTELRKRITSLAAEGERLVLLDNLTGSIGNGTLDAALTGDSWKDRILGVSRMWNGPLNVVWYATGNNVVLCGDTPRRTCQVRLETDLENPEERSGFRYVDLRAHIRANRPLLLSAVMTILRGWVVAERPADKSLKPWGSYEGWSDVVRQAVVWVGAADPGLARMSVTASADPAREAMGHILCHLAKRDAAKGSDQKKGHTAGEIVELAKDSDDKDGAVALRGAIEDLCGRLDSRSLGNRLKHFRRTPIRGCTSTAGRKTIRSSGG